MLLTDIGKGLSLNPITKFVDAHVSADSGNGLIFGSDNGLFYPSDGAVRIQVALDLGSTPVYSKHMTIPNPSVKTTSRIELHAQPITDELEMDGLVCAAGCVVNGTIDVYITAVPGPIVGARMFNLTIR